MAKIILKTSIKEYPVQIANGLNIRQDATHNGTAKASIPIPKGKKVYYEIYAGEFANNTNYEYNGFFVMPLIYTVDNTKGIGIHTSTFTRDNKSVCYEKYDGKAHYIFGNFANVVIPQKWDVFGVCIDVKNSTYYINLNNKLFCRYIPRALDLSAIPDDFHVLINGLCTNDNFTEYTVNFGATPLRYTPPEGYKSFQQWAGYQELYLTEENAAYGIQTQ